MTGIGGCIALCNLLMDSSCKIHSLDISNNDLNNDCIGMLSSALAFHKNTVKELNIGSQEEFVASSGFKALSEFLSGSSCMLEKLELVLVGDKCAYFLADLLVANKTLKHINFRSSTDVSLGWMIILPCLRGPDSVLVEMNLRNCGIGDQGAVVLFTKLEKNITLKKLVLSENRRITPEGWVQSFCILLSSSFSTLEEFSLDDNNIGDPAATALIGLLLGRLSGLRSLSLKRNDSVTIFVWSCFGMALQASSSSKLRKLHIRTSYVTNSSINDTIITAFSRALSKNTRLEDLDLGCTNISEGGWFCLFEAFCDSSSVNNICYNSNHTLKKMSISRPMDIPHYISTMIFLNSHKEWVVVAPVKANLYYFSSR